MWPPDKNRAREASRGVNLEWEALGGVNWELTLSWAGWGGPGDVGKGREGGEDKGGLEVQWERQRVGRERL